jgi:hypothetical protein
LQGTRQSAPAGVENQLWSLDELVERTSREGERPMTYTVTHGSGATALDIGFDLESALAHAQNLLFDGQPNVTIQDGHGHSISGPDLVACCNGEKTLTLDLRAN